MERREKERLAESEGVLAHQFDDLEQQREAATLGMWVFLVTEIMFFGGLFTGYTVYRWLYLPGFADASRHLDIVAGAVNTAILIASSLMVALAVHAAQVGARKLTVIFLLLTLVFGLAFLGIKAYEYYHHIHEHQLPGPAFNYSGKPQLASQAELFFSFYFAMTGMHALHMIVGVGIISVIAFFAWRGHYTAEYHNSVEVAGLYWHFVDIVWIFLFPLLYLIDRT